MLAGLKQGQSRHMGGNSDVMGFSQISSVYYSRDIGDIPCPGIVMSTVLEQDHFCSDFLVLHVTVLTNSLNPDDAIMPPVTL